jgi:hypothetical protein
LGVWNAFLKQPALPCKAPLNKTKQKKSKKIKKNQKIKKIKKKLGGSSGQAV